MGTGLLPAGQQQSLTWHMPPSKISCGPGGAKAVMPREAPPAQRAAGREGRAAGRQALLPSDLFPHLDSGVPGVFAGGRGRVAGACAAAVLTDGWLQQRPFHPSAQQQHMLLALHPQCSMACYPNTSYCPRVYAPREPGESRGKASGAEGGGRSRASACPLSAASADGSTGRRRSSRDHVWGFFGLL